MRKFRFLIPLVALGMLASCSSQASLPVDYDPEDVEIDTPWEEYNIPVEELNFAQGDYDVVLPVGGTHTYSFTYAPKNATPGALKWDISDNTVVSIAKNDNGDYVATGLAAGKATITVSGGEESLFDPIMLDIRVDIPLVSYQVTTESLDLDFGESAQIVTTFNPDNTTQKDLHYEILDKDLITVSDYGIVRALEKAGTTKVVVSSDFNSSTYEVNVTVSNKYVYLNEDGFAIDAENKLEIGKTANLSVSMAPSNHSAKESDVTYSTSTPEILEVNASTGEVKALKVGEGKVKATVPQRGADKETPEFTINVFEVKIASLSLGDDSHATINLGNKGTTSHQLNVSYTVDDTGYTEPSIKEIVYKAEPEGVVKVSNSGLVEIVGPGSATITVTDNHTGKNDYCTVNVTINAESLSLSSDRISLYADEIATLTATTVPNKISGDIEWTVPSKIVVDKQEANILKVHASEPGTYVFKAEVDGLISNEVSIQFNYRAAEFLAGKYYVAGSSDFSSGTSAAGASWNDANKAFMLNEELPADPETKLDFQVRGTVTFATGDEFKIRSELYHQNIVWNDDQRENHYEISEKIATKVLVLDGEDAGESYGNFYVAEGGEYRVLYKVYRLGQPDEWATVYIDQKESLNVNKESVSVGVGETTTLKVSDWTGTLNFVVADETVISAVDSEGHGLYTITGLKAGSTTIAISDDAKSLDPIPVTVSQINYKSIYLDANKMFDSDNVSMFAHAWDENGGKDYALAAVDGEESIYVAEINQAYDHIIFTRGPEGATSLVWEEIYNQTLDLEIPTDKNMWKMTEWVESTPLGEWGTYTPTVVEFYLTPASITLYVGQTETVVPHNNKGSVSYSSSNSEIATVDPASGVITAVAPGDVTISGNDGHTNATVSVRVNYEPVIQKHSLYVNAYGHLDLDGAVLFIHAWDANGAADYKLSVAAGQTIVYTAEVNKAYDHLVIVRCEAGATEIDWPDEQQGKAGNIWNKTADLEIPEDKDMFTFSSYADGFIVGSWSVYDKDHVYEVPAPLDTKTKLYLDVSEITWWANDDCAYAFIYKEGGDNAGAWPGLKMTAVTPTLLCVEVTNIEKYDRLIFVRYGEGQVYNRSSKDGMTAIEITIDWSTKNTWKFNSDFANSGVTGIGFDDGNYTGSWTFTEEA